MRVSVICTNPLIGTYSPLIGAFLRLFTKIFAASRRKLPGAKRLLSRSSTTRPTGYEYPISFFSLCGKHGVFAFHDWKDKTTRQHPQQHRTPDHKPATLVGHILTTHGGFEYHVTTFLGIFAQSGDSSKPYGTRASGQVSAFVTNVTTLCSVVKCLVSKNRGAKNGVFGWSKSVLKIGILGHLSPKRVSCHHFWGHRQKSGDKL